MAPLTDLQIAVSALATKKARYDALWRYYDGNQPLVYSSEKLREIFSGLNASFTENWCAVVIDSVLDRMELRTPSVPDSPDASATLASVWEKTGLVDDEYTIHEDVTVTGESYVIAWPGEDGTVEAFHNDARVCHACYDGDNPRMMRFAAKWWRDADAKVRLTMYYPDRLEYWISRRDYKSVEMPTDRAFEPWSDEPVVDNPYGVIPVFHFRSNRREPKSQLASVIEVQDMVNKMLADMMVAAEFGAYQQRYVISQAGIDGLKNRPFGIWDLVAADGSGQPTSAGQFPHTPLSNYLDAINKLSADIGIITRTPRHYFYAQGGDPSGEALIAMEAPLNKKTERIQATLMPTWRDLAAFLLLLQGTPIQSQDILAMYGSVATVQPKTMAEIRKLNVESGMPLITVLRDEGWTPDELAELETDMQDAKIQQSTFASAVLGAQQTAFDQGAAV